MVSKLEMNSALEARDLSKRDSAVTAVRGVSFGICPGEVLGVLGPNGAGKSTIGKMFTGLLAPSRGAVLFRGARIDQHGADYGTSATFQSNPSFTGF